MSVLVITKSQSVLKIISEYGTITESWFITPEIEQARQFAKLFDPIVILVAPDSDCKENRELISKWPNRIQHLVKYME